MNRAAETSQPAVSGAVALKFAGQTGEYFRIWIVNICLTVVTLGIYSAWAKVRRKRYFYGCTLLEGSAFEYTGNPVTILKGRLIVFAAFIAFSLLSEIHPAIQLVLFITFLGFLPWAILRALQFNARNSIHRNVRFGFNSTKREVGVLLLIPIFLVPLTLGLAYPYYLHRKRRFFLEHSTYGRTAFGFTASARDYYYAALKLSLAFVGFLIGSIATLGIGLIPLYVLLRAYAEATFADVAWRNTTLGDIRFACGWKAGELFVLYFVNALAVLVSVGLLVPWAAIRTARYKLERIVLQSEHGLGGFLTATQENVGAVGDEAGELLGFDFGL